MGTSLTVHPFASLARLPRPGCPRVLINLDHVGDFGRRPDDVILLGKCDDIVKKMCKELGWDAELEKLWKKTESTVVPESELDQKENKKDLDGIAANLGVEAEVEKLADKVGAALALGDVASRIQEKQSEVPTSTKSSVTPDAPLVVQGEKLPEPLNTAHSDTMTDAKLVLSKDKLEDNPNVKEEGKL